MLRTQPPRTGLVDLNLPAATVWTGSSHACRRSAITVNLTGNHPGRWRPPPSRSSTVRPIVSFS